MISRMRRGLATLLLLLAGCTSSLTREEVDRLALARRAESLAAVSTAVVGTTALADFVLARTATLVEGVDPTALDPAAELDVTIGAAAAVAPDGYFLTAAHCTRGAIWLRVARPGAASEWTRARVVWTGAPGVDLALVRVEGAIAASFEWANEAVPGALVVGAGLGSPQTGEVVGRELRFSPGPTPFAGRLGRGSLQPPRAGLVPARDVLSSTPFSSGDSGGPLATADGALVAVNTDACGLRTEDGGIARFSVSLRPDPAAVERLITADRARR
jgi:S1-C subfamily serine protease